MTDFLKADIFFFVSTIAVALVALAWLILLYYVITLVRDTRKLVRLVYGEVMAVRAQRQFVSSRLRFASKWFKHFARALEQTQHDPDQPD